MRNYFLRSDLMEAKESRKRIPSHVIEKVNAALDTTGRPYIAEFGNDSELDGNCWFWELPKVAVGFDASGTPVIFTSLGIQGTLSNIRGLLSNEPLMAYKSIDCWVSVYETCAFKIVVCSVTDQFDLL